MKFKGTLRDEFKKAVRYWAEHHPTKNEVCASIGADDLTPLDIADAVENETPHGLDFIAFVEAGATKNNLSAETVIAYFKNPNPPQP